MELRERLKNNKIAINCDTIEKAKQLFEILDNWNIIWVSGRNLYDYENFRWESSGEKTCYTLRNYFRREDDKLGYSSIKFYQDEGYEIWAFEEFMEEYNKAK